MPLAALLGLHGVLTAAEDPTEVAPPSFDRDLVRAELVSSDTDAQLIAFDVAGIVLGSIAVWVDDDGQVNLVADFGDGCVTTTIIDGRTATESTLAPGLVQHRMNAMLEVLEVADYEDPQANKWRCAVAIAGVVLACAKPSFGCPIALYGAACACLPLVDKDFECPE